MIYKLFRRISFLLAFILLINTTLVFAASIRVAVIEKVTGTVSIKKSGGEKKLKAIKGANLAEGDTLITGSDGTAIVKMDDNKTISVGPNTVINVKDLKGTKGNETTTLNQPKGVSVTRIDNKLTGASTYNQKTPTAIMGVKGTIFSVEAAGEQFFISVVDGKVSVQAASSSQSSATLIPGQQLAGSNTSLGEVAALDVKNLNNFILSIYHNNADSLPPDIAQKIADYISAHPEVLAPSETYQATPNQIINYSDTSVATGAGGGSSNSGGSTPIIPNPSTTDTVVTPDPGTTDPGTTDPDPDDSFNYLALQLSEYISSDETTSCQGLISLFKNNGITAADNYYGTTMDVSMDSGNEKIDLNNLSISCTQTHTVSPNGSIEIPYDVFNLGGNFSFGINERLTKDSTKNNQWQALCFPTNMLGDTNRLDLMQKLLNSWYTLNNASQTASGLELFPTVAISFPSNPMTHSVEIKKVTTSSIITIEPYQQFELECDNTVKSIVLDGDEINISDSSLTEIINLIKALNYDVPDIYLSIRNNSDTPRQIEFDVVNRPYINSGTYTFSFLYYLAGNSVDVALRYTSFPISSTELTDPQNIYTALEESGLRKLVNFIPESVQVTDLNLLDWQYEPTNNTLPYPLENKVVYYTALP